MKTKTEKINVSCPSGMYGKAVAPWSVVDVYAVAANWAQASAPVMVYGHDGTWRHEGRQVGDFRHSATEALRTLIEEVIAVGGDEVDDDEIDEIDEILDEAISIDGRDDDDATLDE